ncbi:MAG: MarR family winged helix-turn-helix transcriptional regulator [Candidatus Thorarchaeota archaeon SMTZ1-83]|nr:MAG: MarR family transcriptional regulator [Candidatus Thorarchaeota archaeon SMTZ1-83]
MTGMREGGFLITKIHHLSGRIFSRRLRELEIEISPGQGRVIFSLWQEDGISINELGKRTQLGKSTLTEVLDRLEESGHLRRIPSEKDGRKTLIELTDKTKRSYKKYEQASQAMLDLFYRGLTDSEIDDFEDLLRRVLSNLVDYESKLG